MEKLPLVLLPGTLCDASLFAHQVQHLAGVAAPVVVDVSKQHTLAEVARYVLGQVAGAFAIAGLSYGGIVALEVWRQQPDRVRNMAMLNTNPYPASAETRARQQQFVEMAHHGEFREITTDFLKDVMLHPDHQKDQKLRGKVLAMAENTGIQGFVNEVKAQLARPDSMPNLPHITCPVLVLTGRDDQVIPLPVHQAMADALPNSRLVIIDHCGHLSTMEQPRQVTEALREWLLAP